TQREGVELEQMLRQLERRLGNAGEQVGQRRTKVTVRRPTPARPVPVTVRREPSVRPGGDTTSDEGVSLETEASRSADGDFVHLRPLAQVPPSAPDVRPARRAAPAPPVSARPHPG